MDQKRIDRIANYLQTRQEDMVALLTQLVELESPTDDKAALDQLSGFLVKECRALGAEVQVLSQQESGNHVRARWGSGTGGVLILCHMDTVWDVGTIRDRPVRIEDEKLYGPGAFDMKGGIVNVLWALRTLRALDLTPSGPVTLVLNSDEETGSATSRDLIEAEARRHDVVFVLEPAEPPLGSYKTWRKGVGAYRIEITGLSAHSGADHARGISAIHELALQVQTIQSLTNYETGTTLNVGLAQGGTRTNVVPEHAWAQIDVRVVDQEQAAAIHEALYSLRPQLEGARIHVTGDLERPPMVRTPQIAGMFAQAQRFAARLGFDLTETGSGGGSDGNFTAALGVPTLDGMGVVGEGGHALHEHVVIPSLPQRASLLALMILENAAQ